LIEDYIEARLIDTGKETELGKCFGLSVVTPEYEVYESDQEDQICSPEVDDYVVYHGEGYIWYITTQVLLPKENQEQLSRGL
jgi:hypothetical protein